MVGDSADCLPDGGVCSINTDKGKAKRGRFTVKSTV